MRNRIAKVKVFDQNDQILKTNDPRLNTTSEDSTEKKRIKSYIEGNKMKMRVLQSVY